MSRRACRRPRAALCAQLEAIARAKPLILVIENLQWADRATLEAISRIAYGREALPLLLVASYRDTMRNYLSCPARTLMLDLIVHGAASELRLRALGTADVKQLLLTSSPVALPRGAVEAIERCAGGNPLIVTALAERMVAEVRESGTSELVDMLSRREHEGEFLPEAVPQVIRHALELHLGELSRLARIVLECGSNGGFWFSAWCVSKVLGLDQEEVEETCRAMCGSDQLLRESKPYVFPNGGVTPVYRFRSRLEARLLLAGQSHARRDFVQQRFAEAVEQSWGDEVGSVAARMAERFERARQWPRALHYAKLAVANAAHTSSQDAASLLQRGLRLSERLPQERRNSEKDFFLRQLSQFS